MRRVHTFSTRTVDAVAVLGLAIARARRVSRWSQAELAERAGVSPDTLGSVERGAPTVAIGIVFEVAALVGLDLFGADADQLPSLVNRGRDQLSLLPSRVRTRGSDVFEDDF